MIFEAKLPARPGYIELVNPETGEHYYHKVGLISGYSHETIVITRSQTFKLSVEPRHATIKVTCVGGGGSMQAGISGGSGQIVTKNIHIAKIKDMEIAVTIGSAGTDEKSGEPTSFGDRLCANGGLAGFASETSGYALNGDIYGLGETADNAATAGVCVIEYDAPIYGA